MVALITPAIHSDPKATNTRTESDATSPVIGLPTATTDDASNALEAYDPTAATDTLPFRPDHAVEEALPRPSLLLLLYPQRHTTEPTPVTIVWQ